MNQVKKNFIYNIFYEILAVCVPLITTPYASRILGAEGIGLYSYTYSIAYYFMIIAMLGINNYGNREIAKAKNSKEVVSKKFFEIYFLQIIISTLVLLVYFAYIMLFKNYVWISIIQSLYIFSSLLDINWFYNGMENFKITVTRNSMIKIISLFMIFTFVKKPGDVWIYTLILAGSTFCSNVFLILFLKKFISFEGLKKLTIKDICSNLKPCLVLFIPVIAMKIYKVMDKTMIGVFSSISEVGFYTNADGIINIPMGIIIALGTVMLPRLSNMIANGQKENAEKAFFKTLKFGIFIGVSIMFGLMAIGKDFSIIFLGENFEKTGYIVQILSITILFMTIANIIRTQYLIPNEKDKEYIISIVIGAIVNLILNVIFIKRYGAYGACIGTITAEFLVMFFHVYFANKYISIFKYLIKEYMLLIKGFIMFLMVKTILLLDINIFNRLFIQVCTGIIVYILLNYRYIMNELNVMQFINKFRKKENV